MAHTTLTIIVSMLFGAAVIEVPRRYFSDSGTTIDVHIITDLSNTITHQGSDIITINKEISKLRRQHYHIRNQMSKMLKILFGVNGTITSSLEENTKMIFDNTNRTMTVNMTKFMDKVQSSLHCVENNGTRGFNIFRNRTMYSIFSFKINFRDQGKLIQGTTNQIQSMKTAFSKQCGEIENIKTELHQLNASVYLTFEKFTKMEEQQRNLHIQHYKMKSEQEFAEANSTPIETFYFTIFASIVLEVFIALVFWMRLRSMNQGRQSLMNPPRHYANNFAEPHVIIDHSSEGQILSKVSKRNLQKSVCVLSFYRGTTHENHLCVSKSFLDEAVKLEDFVVNKHEDILGVPDSKVMLVHVDYNARNIILENPNRELGDLKRTTVLALQKMGAEVIFFYYEERNGHSVDNGKLYNPQLESVKLHTVLKELESKQRVISLPRGTELTAFQQQHLKKEVSSLINC